MQEPSGNELPDNDQLHTPAHAWVVSTNRLACTYLATLYHLLKSFCDIILCNSESGMQR
jgi:hypothetical protein